MTTQTDTVAMPTGSVTELGLVRAARTLFARVRVFWAEQQREADIDRISDALGRLNDRQLAALGLKRDMILGYAAARVDALHDGEPLAEIEDTRPLALPRAEA